jgi:serine/threonine protein kinase
MSEETPDHIENTESINTAYSRDDWRPGEIRRQTGTGLLNTGDVLFGAYEITGKLGEGGMGAVYSAKHISLGSARAIKVMSASLSMNEDAVERFRREAKALLDVHHPAVVRCHDLLSDEHGCIFLVMELIEGTPLSKRLAERALNEKEVLDIAERIGGGLVAAHAQGVIHRDLSPDNVMLPGGRTDQAKLVDFGIAKILRLGEETISAGFKGKLAYASPEQLGFFDGEIGPASDFFSLGLVLAGASMGRRLDMGKNFATAVEARRTPVEIPGGVPAALRPGLAKLLALNPTERPRSLEGVFDGTLALIGKRKARRRAFGIAAGLLIGVGIGGMLLRVVTTETPHNPPNPLADVAAASNDAVSNALAPNIDDGALALDESAKAPASETQQLFYDLRSRLISARSESLQVQPVFEISPKQVEDRGSYSLKIRANCECYPLVFFIDANDDSIDLLYPNPNEPRVPLGANEMRTIPGRDSMYFFEAEAGTGVDRLKLLLLPTDVEFPAVANSRWNAAAASDDDQLLVSFLGAAGGDEFWSASPTDRENLDELAQLLNGLGADNWTSAETILHVVR